MQSEPALIKKVLFIIRSGPFDGLKAREAIDAVLATAAFEQHVTVHFQDEGVRLLNRDMNPEALKSKNLGKMIKAFGMYGVSSISVSTGDCKRYNCSPENAVTTFTTLDQNGVRELIANQDVTLVF
ncbi:protein required for 2-thiolation step of mnm(5)-s(2)U34-tRNA synthesis [Oleiphilus messinensis]|uniref:Protein required for 2-thiolation step of mnm(5)-s(2)U34-tRNA synthesis n=1 Tax=Oleiphilus messinensis TaxID=141451 RepID=A0A1Y0IBB3_9GAMM|nr:DsrE family protein [Oleiphilus messinensis]ARU57056.1 protein required for 2-thiolation step of mnm(5)-s(2)U34-tRNA synthesis [Oleiphilus messinensis]